MAKAKHKPKLPEKFEFLPAQRSVIIKKERNDKAQYMDWLLEADPSEEMIQKYLPDGELFVLTYQEEPACIAVAIKVDDDTVELKNIATAPKYRRQGYGKKMIKYLADNYKQKYKKMMVGTAENKIPFFVKQGFEKYEKTAKNFFVDHYDEKIMDGDLQCVDMYYYAKDLMDDGKR